MLASKKQTVDRISQYLMHFGSETKSLLSLLAWSTTKHSKWKQLQFTN